MKNNFTQVILQIQKKKKKKNFPAKKKKTNPHDKLSKKKKNIKKKITNRDILNIFIQLILDNMIGYVNLNVIVNKIITDHSTSELYEFKDIIKTVLDTYAYELSILSNCNKLISTNNFKLFKKYKTNIQHSFGNKEEQQQEEGNFFCLICNQALDQYVSNSYYMLM